MDRIRLLDCTLRDGGYINNFNFGKPVIQDVIEKLSKANIDIVECGFLRSGEFDPDRTLFGGVEMINQVIQKKKPGTMYVAMLQAGKMPVEEIADCSEETIDGIRLTFHEEEIDESFEIARALKEKGYLVFFQPVGTTTYSDEDLLKLVRRTNALQPYAFYMVDTLGTMYGQDTEKMFHLIDKHLDENICLGFHSHNNVQMSFSNAQLLMNIPSERNLIIDGSVLGMGRGAGNLNTELITEYYNIHYTRKYASSEILEIVDRYIRPLSMSYSWGYDAAYYISSSMKCHPNYAAYLLNLQTLQAKDIFTILSLLDEKKRHLFDEKYISEVYVRYLSNQIDDSEAVNTITDLIENRPVFVVAPGKTVSDDELMQQIKAKIRDDNGYVVSVNFLPDNLPVDMLFISNAKRFVNIRHLNPDEIGVEKIVTTSNIDADNIDQAISINYTDYLNEDNRITDNAGMLCLNMLKKAGAKEIRLIGFDGFSKNQEENYYRNDLRVKVELERLLGMNSAIRERIDQLRQDLIVSFLTPSEYQ